MSWPLRSYLSRRAMTGLSTMISTPTNGAKETTEMTTTTPSGNEHDFLVLNRDDGVVYDGPVFKVVKRCYVSPDGQHFDRDVVVTQGAVAVVPMVDDYHVALVRHWRAATETYGLELPAGKLDVEGEDHWDAALRELKEELGYEASKMNMSHLVTYNSAIGFAHEPIVVYLAWDLKAGQSAHQGPEERYITEVVVDLRYVDKMISSGQITDSKTIIGLMMARNQQGLECLIHE